MKSSYRWLAVIVGLHLLAGLAYDRATPIFEASDEGAHYAVIRRLAQGYPLPVQDPGSPAQPWAQEGSQPPLYYFLGAGLTAWIDTSDYARIYVPNPFSQLGVPGTTYDANLFRHPWGGEALTGTALAVRLVRWFSLLLSCLTVWLAFKLARRVFPGQETLALLAAALMASNPMALFINASVNNDNLLMLLSTAVLLVVVRLMRPAAAARFKHDLPWLALLGLLLGMAALTKVSGLVLWPVAALGVGWGAWRARDCKRLVLGGLVVAGIASLICGWWFWRNYALYGDWLGLNVMVAIAGPRSIALADLVRQEWFGFYQSYWGVFGVFTILPPAWVQAFFGALTILALAGGGVVLLKNRAWPRAETWLLALFCAFTLLGVIRWTMQTFASQGRLLFGAIAPLSIFMALGLQFWTSDFGFWKKLGVGNLGVGGLTCALFAVAFILPAAYIPPHYAPPPVLAEAELPKDLREVHVTFGEQIELVGYTSDSTPRAPGESQRVTLYWRALKSMDKDYAVALHLLGRGVEEVGKIDTWPGGGNAPTSQWQAGSLLADSYQLPIAAGATAPSTLKLALAFWEGVADNQLPMRAASGEQMKMVAFQVGRVVPARPPSFAPAIVEGAKFEYGISLLGVEAGGAGRVTLYWQTDQVVPADYTVFLHLLDAGGGQVAQADGPPLNGDWPTSAWLPGQAFADARQFDLPPNLAPGRYTVRLGFYDPASGARVGAYRPDGAEWPDDMVLIRSVVEIK